MGRQFYIAMVVIFLIEISKLGFLNTMFEQVVVSMAIGFGHHGQVQVQYCYASTASKQDLSKCSIKTTFECIGFTRLCIFVNFN